VLTIDTSRKRCAGGGLGSNKDKFTDGRRSPASEFLIGAIGGAAGGGEEGGYLCHSGFRYAQS